MAATYRPDNELLTEIAANLATLVRLAELAERRRLNAPHRRIGRFIGRPFTALRRLIGRLRGPVARVREELADIPIVLRAVLVRARNPGMGWRMCRARARLRDYGARGPVRTLAEAIDSGRGSVSRHSAPEPAQRRGRLLLDFPDIG